MGPYEFLSNFIAEYGYFHALGVLDEDDEGMYPVVVLRNVNIDPIWNLLHLLPPEVEGLSIENCGVMSIPPGLAELPNLRKVWLRKNQITSFSPSQLPKAIGELDLSDNYITEFPSGWGDLEDLYLIILKNNQITEIPPWINELEGVDFLDLSGNPLRKVSEEILNSSIGDLDIENTGLPSLSYSIIISQIHIRFNPDRDLADLPKSYRNLLGGTHRNLGDIRDIILVGRTLAYIIRSTDENYTWFHVQLGLDYNDKGGASILIDVFKNHVLATLNVDGNPDYRGYLGLLSVALGKDYLYDGSVVGKESLPSSFQNIPSGRRVTYDNYVALSPSILVRKNDHSSNPQPLPEEAYSKLNYRPQVITKRNVRTFYDLERDYYLREMLEEEQTERNTVSKKRKTEFDQDVDD